MARSRLRLHEILVNLLPENEQFVYFQPKSNVTMQYPCIVYQRDYDDTKFANNSPYGHYKRYRLTVIDRDPDSEIPDKVKNLPLVSFDRFFVADGLNHDIYKIYF